MMILVYPSKVPQRSLTNEGHLKPMNALPRSTISTCCSTFLTTFTSCIACSISCSSRKKLSGHFCHFQIHVVYIQLSAELCLIWRYNTPISVAQNRLILGTLKMVSAPTTRSTFFKIYVPCTSCSRTWFTCHILKSDNAEQWKHYKREKSIEFLRKHNWRLQYNSARFRYYNARFM